MAARPGLQLSTLKNMGSHKNCEVDQEQKPIISDGKYLKGDVSTPHITVWLDLFSYLSKAASLAY